MTNILDLPDEILMLLFGRYLNIYDITRVSKCCKKFYYLVVECKLLDKFLERYPLLDYSYPYGFSDNFVHNNKYFEDYSSRAKINIYLNGMKRNFSAVSKVFYSYSEKMLPHIQLDEFDNQNDTTSLLLTDANQIRRLNTAKIRNYIPSKFQNMQMSTTQMFYTTANKKNLNSIVITESWKVFERDRDIKSFRKKNELLVSFSNDKLVIHELVTKPKNEIRLVKEINDVRINCADFSLELNKLVYGCSNGLLKVFNIEDESEECNLVNASNLTDRLLRCVISPNQKNLAIGSAGVRSHGAMASCPLRIFDFERLTEMNVLKLSRGTTFRVGAGVLALNYIDDNTLISSGYDTFIRIFDLRSNTCTQSMEEPEDYSVYCLCSSLSYGLLSGLDRYGIIRYWDRRFSSKIVKSYNSTNSNSPVYSLACTPNNIYAGWERGVTSIQLT